MADWTDVPTLIAALAAGKAFTDEKAQALAENAAALGEAAPNSPVNLAAWHPYDMVTVGDGATGKFYDFAINGAVATVTTPTLDAGYDYLIRWLNVSPSQSPSATLQMAGVAISPGIAQASSASGSFEICNPGQTDFLKKGLLHGRSGSGFSTGAVALSSTLTTYPFLGMFVFSSFAAAISSIAFTWSAGNFDGGEFYLYRRRNFMSA